MLLLIKSPSAGVTFQPKSNQKVSCDKSALRFLRNSGIHNIRGARWYSGIQWAEYWQYPGSIHHVCVDHGGGDICVTQQLM